MEESKMAKLYIKGWVSKDDDYIISVKENKDDSWNAYSLPRQVKEFAYDNGRVRDVKNGLGGTKSYIFDASIHIYFTNEKSTIEEAREYLIFKMCGDVETDIRLTGYSEYTITGYSLEEFSIGGHDLESEISSHMGEYMHFVLEC
jgi:hypothetical protein